jgi:hypothetical protein
MDQSHFSGEAGLAYRYAVFGLSISSPFPLPELEEAPVAWPADVEIVLGEPPLASEERLDGFFATPTGGLLDVLGIARYRIDAGRRITVEPYPTGSERHMRLYLLGSALGALLHQRRLLPLHANAMHLGGQAVAFMGKSGAGKSTMAAWFHDRGSPVLADDVCVVTLGDGGEPMAHPGIPRLRLWRDALEASGRSADAHEHAFDDADKYNVPTRRSRTSGAISLGAIYLLDEPGGSASVQAITPLRGVAAMDALVSNTYRGSYATTVGALPQLIATCQALATKVPVFSVQRVWGRDRLDEQMEALERHARDVVKRSRSSTIADVD